MKRVNQMKKTIAASSIFLGIILFIVSQSCNDVGGNVSKKKYSEVDTEMKDAIDNLLKGTDCNEKLIEEYLATNEMAFILNLIRKVDSNERIRLLHATKGNGPEVSTLVYDNYFIGIKILCLLDVIFTQSEDHPSICNSCVQGRIKASGKNYNKEDMVRIRRQLAEWYENNRSLSDYKRKEEWLKFRDNI